MARRGQVKVLHSDNGTNCVGAEIELKRAIEEWNKMEFPEKFISLPDVSIKKPQLLTINFVYPFLPWSPVDVFPSSSLKPRQYLSFNRPQMCSH